MTELAMWERSTEAWRRRVELRWLADQMALATRCTYEYWLDGVVARVFSPPVRYTNTG